MSDGIAFALGRTSVVLAVSAVLVAVSLRLGRCPSPRVHRIAWVAVLLQGVLYFQFPLSLPVLAPERPVVRPVDLPGPARPEPPPGVPAGEQAVPPPEPPAAATPWFRATPGTIALSVWALGFLTVWGLRCVALHRLARQLKSAKPAEAKTRKSLREVYAAGFDLRFTEHFGPAVFHRTILFPLALWEESPERIRRGILGHELSHARHRDGLKSFLLSLVATIHWFNPLSWFALKKFNDAGEWRCDAEAFGAEANGVVAFAESMLALGQSRPKYVAWVRSYKNRDIHERVKRLRERAEKESEWIERLEGPEPGHPGNTGLHPYDEAIFGLASIKSGKAAKLTRACSITGNGA